MGWVGLIIITSIIVMALGAPWIAPYYWKNPPGSPILIDQLLQPPSAEHLLGTNQYGEDIFSRVIYGSQISLLVGFLASLVAVFLGTSVGLISGYYGGYLDLILMRITDVFLCLPTLPLMLIFLHCRPRPQRTRVLCADSLPAKPAYRCHRYHAQC